MSAFSVSHLPSPVSRFPCSVCLALLLALAGAGCRQDMRDQSRLNPLTGSRFFTDGQASRLPVEHTIARDHLRGDEPWFTGKTNGVFVNEVPRGVAVDLPLLERGRERFGIYCTPCHDAAGTGQGMIVQRGFTQPRSYHDPQVRAQPLGYYYDVMTRGFGNMPDYAAQVPVADRWAIATYIRALQVSQHMELDALPDADRQAYLAGLSAQQAEAAAAAAAAGAHGAGHGQGHHE